MKKFLAIFTIVAMLSGMCTIGASAAVDALDATIELVEASAEVTNVDLSAALGAQLSYDPSAANFAGLANDFKGFHAITGVGSASSSWWASSSNGPSDFRATAVRIPGFFKDKPAGTYKLNFRVCARNAYTGNEELGGYILDVAETVNTGAPVYAESFKVISGTLGGWVRQTVEFTFNYDGVAEITNPAVDAAAYDPYALCFYIVSQKGGGKQYNIDNHFYATAPVTAGKNVKATNTITGDFADSVLINAVYDGEGSLVAVNTKDLASETSVELKLPYEGEAAHDWTFKGFIWKDLDSTIEPLAETAEIGFDTLLPYIYSLDFDTWTLWGDATTPKYSLVPTDANFIGLKSTGYTGPFKTTSGDVYWRQNIQWGQNPNKPGDLVAQNAGMTIAIPEFFKNKPAGTYTIEFDYYDQNTAWNPMKGRVISVGDLVNGTVVSTSLLSGSEAVCNGDIRGSWAHAELTYNWDGNAVEIEGADADLYDPYMLIFWMGRGTDAKYYIDNIKITAPFVAQ